MLGVYAAGGALRVTLNDATSKGSYMPDGSLRVTDVAGRGILDASGAWRIANVIGLGVYQARADALRYGDASIDGKVGVYEPDGALRMLTNAPSNGYVAEDGVTNYVAEDGTTFYVQET